MKFNFYNGDTGRLPTSDKYLNFKWQEPGTDVLFSACQQGKGIRYHFTADKKSLRKMKRVIAEWEDFCFNLFGNAEVLFAIIDEKKHGVIKLAESCNYRLLVEYKGLKVYIKEKPCQL